MGLRPNGTLVGRVVSAADDAQCLNGAYAVLTTSNATESFPGNGTSAFATEAACVLYVGQGGQPVVVNKAGRTGIIWGD